MANHMETYITIKNGDIKVAEKLKEIFTPAEGEYEVHTEDLYKRLYGDEAPEEYDRGWVCDNLGAKWVYSEFEYDEEPQHIHLLLTSAWSVPIQMLEKLAEILTNIKEDCYICGTYEDESMDPLEHLSTLKIMMISKITMMSMIGIKMKKMISIVNNGMIVSLIYLNK